MIEDRIMELDEKYGIESKDNVILTITCTDGMVIEGRYYGYTPAYDNDPEIESIDILQPRDIKENTCTVIFDNEIKSIEVKSFEDK